MKALRCNGCGNKTRFDIYETKRTKTFHHFTLGGEDVVEDEEVFETTVEKIVCRWCGAADQIVEEAGTSDATGTTGGDPE